MKRDQAVVEVHAENRRLASKDDGSHCPNGSRSCRGTKGRFPVSTGRNALVRIFFQMMIAASFGVG